MLFMVIERLRDTATVYDRLQARGRMIPDGVEPGYDGLVVEL
ncbi:MAG: DUF3303 family protein [Kiloniellaceae bacterium]